MTDIVKPHITDSLVFLAPQVLAKGSVARATFDLTGKVGAWLSFKLGRGGTTALVVGVTPFVNKLNAAGAATPGGSCTPLIGPGLSQLVAAASTTVNVDSDAGQSELKLASITGMAVGDWICIQDSGGGVTRLEFGQIAKLSVASGTGVTLRCPLSFTHTADQADTVRNRSDVWSEYEVAGGGMIEIGFDYAGESAASEAVTVCVLVRTYDYDEKATI